MTTFTTDDREEAYKKIVAEAPNQPGYEDAVPIPPINQTSKELTDEEILELWVQKNNLNGAQDILDFARAILRKAQENG
jgi:hypothetical protein